MTEGLINIFNKIPIFDLIFILISWAKFFLVINPILRDISCNTIVENIDKMIAQISDKPNEAPAIVHRVTVPGPIKAAAIKIPGPISLNHFIMG